MESYNVMFSKKCSLCVGFLFVFPIFLKDFTLFSCEGFWDLEGLGTLQKQKYFYILHYKICILDRFELLCGRNDFWKWSGDRCF